MHEVTLLINIAVALVVAFIGGVIARRIGLPTIAGYLLAGIAIGPFTPGFVGDVDTISQLAELGVIWWGGFPRTVERPEGLADTAHLGVVSFPTYRLFMLGAAIVVASPAWAACLDSASVPGAGVATAPVPTSRWTEPDRVELAWHWEADVDAFNVIVTRDGARDPQIELPEERRSLVVEARGATRVGFSVQACNKGIVKSACTDWSTSETLRPTVEK